VGLLAFMQSKMLSTQHNGRVGLSSEAYGGCTLPSLHHHADTIRSVIQKITVSKP